jgi:thiamine biosynthesis protein ThiS
LRVQINGEAREVADALRLSELVNELSLTPERVAIELNQRVVRRNLWPETILADGDRIEIVHFVGGGTAVGSRQKAVSSRQ